MKKFGLIIIVLIFANDAFSQSYAGHSRLINFESGYKLMSNNTGMYHAGSLGMDYHAPLLYTTYSIRADVGSDYWSIEPFSALGILWMIAAQSTGNFDYYEPILKLFVVCLAGSSMKFPIRIYYGMFEISPSYSLLRWTYINNQGYMTGALGLSFNYYINKYLYFNSRGEFNFGYEGLGLGYSINLVLGIQIPIDR